MKGWIGLGLAVLSILGLGFPTPGGPGGTPALKPGTPVFAVAPEKVRELAYHTSGFWFVAHRFKEEAFTLIILKPGEMQAETCIAGAGFGETLGRLTSFPLVGVPGPKEKAALFQEHPLHTWGELEIRDVSRLEPFRARVLPVAGRPEEVWLNFAGHTYRVSLNQEILANLVESCRARGGF